MPPEAGYHSRGYLPHIKVPGATYFVTFRLADSLPAEVALRLKERRDDQLRRAEAETAAAMDRARKELFNWYATEIDAVLDQNQGAAWLRRSDIATLVDSALRHFHTERYDLHAWCVMPNHVHTVVKPYPGRTLERILHSWKSFTANEANRLLNRIGHSFWQHESYDHWIRDECDFIHCCEYAENNPVKARLCRTAREWPWSSAAKK